MAFLQDQYPVSVRRSCGLVFLRRPMWYYQPLAKGDQALRMRIRELAESRVRYGFSRIYTLLRREGWKDNHKRVYRVYCEEKLNLRRKRPRRNKAAAHRQAHPEVSTLDEGWSMDFVADQLFDGRRFRALTVLDNYSRQ